MFHGNKIGNIMLKIDNFKNKIIQGDALNVLKTISDESIDCVMTSPPYWALRDYGIEGQLGLESTFQEYITKLCDIFDEIKRVLKKTGTCWVNIGDTYGGSGNNGNYKDPKDINGRTGQSKAINKNAIAKSLCQIPSRFAIQMCNRGWILRNEIIWHKSNAMPSSVKDRFTVDFEKLFFFTKSKKYYFETQYEPVINHSDAWYRHKLRQNKNYKLKKPYQHNFPIPKYPNKKNKRTVWNINTKPFKEAHFAVFPEKLCETPINAGCPKDGIVLDPFSGAGTTSVVAKKQGKSFIGIELNKEYIEIAQKRIAAIPKRLDDFMQKKVILNV